MGLGDRKVPKQGGFRLGHKKTVDNMGKPHRGNLRGIKKIWSLGQNKKQKREEKIGKGE